MMTRVYRVKIKPELRQEFEPLFKSVARASVADCAGCTRVIVGMPSPMSPNEYAMITQWRDVDSLTAFAGADLSAAHIPPGMEKFVDTCWVHHFHHDAVD